MNLKLGLAGLALACAACCARLLATPLLVGTGVAIGLGAVSLDTALCIIVPALALVGIGIWTVLCRQRRTSSSCGCKDRCNAASNGH